MKKLTRTLKDFVSSKRDFLIPCLIVIPLAAYSISSSDKSINPLLGFSLTDLGLVGLAIYAVLKKPWGENLAGHFKKAYRTQLKFIQKSVKERDVLREECNTFSVHQMSFATLESMTEAMQEQDGYPAVSDLGKQLWDGNKEKLLKGLEEIENIKNSEDAAKILGNYAQMVNISSDLRKETIRLQELKSSSKTGEIRGTVWLSDDFSEVFPNKPKFHIPIRLRPEYIKDGFITQFWLERYIFHPYDSNTGKKTKKYVPSCDDRWGLLSMSSPYWKHVVSVILDLEDVHHQLSDGRWIRMPPKNFQLPDGNYLLDLKGKTLFPIRIERDGESC